MVKALKKKNPNQKHQPIKTDDCQNIPKQAFILYSLQVTQCSLNKLLSAVTIYKTPYFVCAFWFFNFFFRISFLFLHFIFVSSSALLLFSITKSRYYMLETEEQKKNNLVQLLSANKTK